MNQLDLFISLSANTISVLIHQQQIKVRLCMYVECMRLRLRGDTITTTKESVKHNIIIVLHLEGSTSFQSGPCSRTAVVAD